jgi:pimeloyl-ACP methyl ester carboxylesterase
MAARGFRPAALASAAGCAGLLLGTVACSAAPVLEATGPAPAAASAPPQLQPYYAQRLGWGPCAGFAQDDQQERAFADPALDCARLEVPLDYAAPDGRTAQVALLRHRTTHQKIGSLVVNPGGPGQSGVEFAAKLAATLGGGPFDVVGFDPRGVARSTPTITCATDAERDADRADDTFDPSPQGVARAEAKAQLRAQHCVERSGGADVLANAGTRDVVRDMDVLRAALGDPKLTYLGFSYGTRIGSTYAEMFPSKVRALVLDGAIDPAQDAAAGAVAKSTGFQQAFQTYAADCARQPDCPLGTDAQRATEVFQALTRPLLERPAPVPQDDRGLSYRDALTAVGGSLYNPRSWPKLTKGLAALQDGDATILLAKADDREGRAPDGTYDNSKDAQLIVNCVDRDRITDRAAAAELDRRTLQAAPFRDPGRGASGALDTCAFLPVPPTSRPHLPVADGLPPTLVISTTGDPATPYQAGVELAQALHAGLLTVEGTQHTAAAHGNACVDDIVSDYLVKLTLPPPHTHCALRAVETDRERPSEDQ